MFDPSILCPDCREKFKHDETLHEGEAHLYSFKEIADWTPQHFFWFISRKGKNENALNLLFWKKKLIQARIIAQGYKVRGKK